MLRRVLVTGATGFIGRHTLPALAAKGYEVHGVGSDPAGPGAHWHRADLLEPDAAAALVSSVRPTHLLHLAWETPRSGFWDSPDNLRWLEASSRLWREFSASGGHRSVFVGSCAEYEWGREAVLSESSTPLRPRTLYGATKDALRRALEVAAAATNGSLAWARVFFVYGPGDHPTRLVPSVVRNLTAGDPAAVTDCRQVRDYLHVSDVAVALAQLLDSRVEGAVNVGSGQGVPLRRIVEVLGAATGRSELIQFGAVPRPEGEPDEIVADIRRLRDGLGWKPEVQLEEGLEAVVHEAAKAVR